MLNREVILQRPRQTETVPTPEWGEGTTVKVKLLTTREFLEFVEMEKRHPDKGPALWLINCVVDDEGNPLFTEADANAIADQPFLVVSRLSAAAQALNLRNTGDLAKNLPATPSGV